MTASRASEPLALAAASIGAETAPILAAAVPEAAPEPAASPAEEPVVAAIEPEAPPADPAAEAAGPESPPEPKPAAEASATPSPDPSNYSVSKGGRITVQADETLGHYAEWLEVRPSTLRRLNKMKSGAPVRIGHTTRLDFRNVTPEVFEERRLQYHLALQEAFFEAYVVSGTETHVLRKGESLWYLAKQKFEVPVWLLRQYNPDLDFDALRPGTQLVVPVVAPREGQT
jgi:membrane-bound lytic murein transglycosylase D